MVMLTLSLSAVLHHSLFEWTNWAFGLIAVCYVVFSELREAKRKRQLRNIALELEPSAPHLHGATANGPELNDRLRSILIQVGVEGQPFSLAVDRAHRFGASPDSVERAARTLRDSKLLRFSDPLRDETKIRLN